MKIENVRGSSKYEKPKGYSSWREYWEKNCGLNFSFQEGNVYKCPACGRGVSPKNWDGCHVQKADSTDRNWYIVPLCDSCNQRENEVLDIGDLKMVPVPSNL